MLGQEDPHHPGTCPRQCKRTPAPLLVTVSSTRCSTRRSAQAPVAHPLTAGHAARLATCRERADGGGATDSPTGSPGAPAAHTLSRHPRLHGNRRSRHAESPCPRGRRCTGTGAALNLLTPGNPDKGGLFVLSVAPFCLYKMPPPQVTPQSLHQVPRDKFPAESNSGKNLPLEMNVYAFCCPRSQTMQSRVFLFVPELPEDWKPSSWSKCCNLLSASHSNVHSHCFVSWALPSLASD